MTETSEELRVIAKDGGRLDEIDRALIGQAADELDEAHRLVVAMQKALIESQAKRIAMNERLFEAKRGLSMPGPVTYRLLPLTQTHWNF